MFNVLSHPENTLKSLWISMINLLEWLWLITAHAGKDVDQGEQSSISGGSVNLHIQFGNQIGGFLKSWE